MEHKGAGWALAASKGEEKLSGHTPVTPRSPAGVRHLYTPPGAR